MENLQTITSSVSLGPLSYREDFLCNRQLQFSAIILLCQTKVVNISMNFDEFYEVFLEADAGKRKEYLEKKYNDKLHSLLKQVFPEDLYPDASAQFKVVYGYSIVDFVMKEMDPTDGVYSEWIIRTMMKTEFKNFLPNFTRNVRLERFFDEDAYKVKEHLEDYHKHKHLFKKLAKDENNPNFLKLADINQIHTFTDLFGAIQLLEPYVEEQHEKNEMKRLEKEVDKVYDSENYLILIPKTEEASCAYGKNTQWCTAAKNRNYFSHYASQGPLYIIIDKKKNKKYQFHFQTRQFMNENDNQVDLADFFKNHSEIKQFIMKLAANNNELYMVLKYDSEFAKEIIPTIPEEKLKKQIKSSLFVALELADSYKDLVNKSQDLIEITDDESSVTLKTTCTKWSDLTNFLDGNIAGRRHADAILDGTEFVEYDISISDSELKEYKDYIDSDNVTIISKYVSQKYQSHIGVIDNLFNLLEDEDDDTIHDLVRRAASMTYDNSYRDAVYEKIIETITDPIPGIGKFEDGKIVFYNASISFLRSLVIELDERKVENEENLVSCDWRELYSSWTDYLDKNNELKDVDYDDIHPDFVKSSFNEILKDLLTSELTIKEEKNYLLSSINKGMTRFDSFISTFLEGLGNMGTGGMANRGPAVTKPSSTTSTTVNRPATTSSQNVNQNHSELDVGAYFKNQSTDWDREMKMPEFQNAVAAHFDKTMLDPKANPQIKNELMTKIQKTPALQKYFQDRMNQQNQMGGIQ